MVRLAWLGHEVLLLDTTALDVGRKETWRWGKVA